MKAKDLPDELANSEMKPIPWAILFWIVAIALAFILLASGSKSKDDNAAAKPPLPVYVAVINGKDTIVYSTGDEAKGYVMLNGDIVEAETDAVVVKAKDVQHAIVIEVTPVPVHVEEKKSPYPCNGTINGDGVRVREQATTSGTVVVELRKGTVVKVIGKTGNWYEVEYEGQSGYVSATYLLLQNQ